jgi:hypothetical protein
MLPNRPASSGRFFIAYGNPLLECRAIKHWIVRKIPLDTLWDDAGDFGWRLHDLTSEAVFSKANSLPILIANVGQETSTYWAKKFRTFSERGCRQYF